MKRCESGGTGTRPLKGKRHLKLRFKHDENNFSSIKINVLLRPQKLDECITSQLPWCPWGEALLRGSWAETQAPPPPAPTDTATTWRRTHDHAGAPPTPGLPPAGEDLRTQRGCVENATCHGARPPPDCVVLGGPSGQDPEMAAAQPRPPRAARAGGAAMRTRPTWRGGHVVPGLCCQLGPRNQESEQWLFFLQLGEMLSKF